MDMFFLREILTPPRTTPPSLDQTPLTEEELTQPPSQSDHRDAEQRSSHSLVADPNCSALSLSDAAVATAPNADSQPVATTAAAVPVDAQSDDADSESTSPVVPAGRKGRRSSKQRSDFTSLNEPSALAATASLTDPFSPVAAACAKSLQLELEFPDVMASLLSPTSCPLDLDESAAAATPFSQATIAQLGSISPRSRHALYSTLSPVFGEDEEESMADQSLDECNGKRLQLFLQSPPSAADQLLPPLTPFSLLVCQQIGAEQQQHMRHRIQGQPMTPRSEQQLLQDALGDLDDSTADGASHRTPPGGSSSSAAATPVAARLNSVRAMASPEAVAAKELPIWEAEECTAFEQMPATPAAATPATATAALVVPLLFDTPQCESDAATTTAALLQVLQTPQPVFSFPLPELTREQPSASGTVVACAAPSSVWPTLHRLFVAVLYLPLMALACLLLLVGLDAALSATAPNSQVLASLDGLLSSALDSITVPLWLSSPLDWMDDPSMYCT